MTTHLSTDQIKALAITIIAEAWQRDTKSGAIPPILMSSGKSVNRLKQSKEARMMKKGAKMKKSRKRKKKRRRKRKNGARSSPEQEK